MRIGKDWEDGLVLEGWAGLEGLNRGAGLAGWNIKDRQNSPFSFRPADFKKVCGSITYLISEMQKKIE